MHLKCEICEEIIARTEPERLRLPLTSAMFDPVGEGYAHPWPFWVMWEHMFCPRCNHRPFVMTEEEIQAALEHRTEGPSRVFTDQGFYDVAAKVFPDKPGEHVASVYTDEELERDWESRERAMALKAEEQRMQAGTVVEQIMPAEMRQPQTQPRINLRKPRKASKKKKGVN